MDINRLIDGFLGSGGGQQTAPNQQQNSGLSGAMSGFPGGLAGGAAAGGLVALMLGSKKARKIGGKALTYGGMAAVGGLAYKAYSDYKKNQQNQPAQPQQRAAPARSAPPPPIQSIPPAPADSGFDPAQLTDQSGNDLRLGLIQAMISAAKADGHIDAAENENIRTQIDATNLAADEKGFLFDQLAAASDPIAIANLAKDETQASELFLASALTIDIDTPEEGRYMERLGDALRLPEALRQELIGHAEAAKAGAV